MRGAAWASSALALLVASGCLSGGEDRDEDGPAFADLVFTNGRVWTGVDDGTAEAVAIRGDEILRVGSAQEIAPTVGPDTRIIDLAGGSLVPGFRDNHNHLLQLAHPDLDPDRGKTGPPTPEMFRPTYDGYDPVQAEAYRAAVFSYHNRVAAIEETPMDGCLHGEVTQPMKDNLLMAQEEAIQQGLVSVVEAGLRDLAQFEALLSLQDEGKLRLRFLVRFAWGCLEQAHDLGFVQDFGGPWVKVQGVKLYSDGWLGPRTAALEEPFSDRPWTNGLLFLPPERALADVSRAHALGYHLTTHAIGDRAMRVILDAYEAAGLNASHRPGIEHASLFSPELRQRFVDQGVVASIQLSFATSDHRWVEDALGPERVGQTYPWRTALDEGVILAGSSDFYIEALAPLWGIQRTVTRQEVDGTPPGGWRPDESLTVAESLRLVTSAAAYAASEDDERGVIAPGQKADLVALREDLFQLPPDQIASATVTHTVVNGVVAFEGARSYAPTPSSLYLQRGPGPDPAHAPPPAAYPPFWED